jgi:hypothetical protein
MDINNTIEEFIIFESLKVYILEHEQTQPSREIREDGQAGRGDLRSCIPSER